MQEIWKDIEGYEGLYQVSNLGRVRRLTEWCGNGNQKKYRDKVSIKTLTIDNVGYNTVTLYKNNVGKKIRVHRLVASAFLRNEANKATVNHIDGNKTNNNVENLEWATYSENEKHAHKTGLKRALRSKEHPLSKSVIQYDIKGNYIKTWDSIMDVERELKISNSSVCQCCLKRLKTAGGYVWKYNYL